MTNGQPPDDGRSVDSESFEEWLNQAADSKGVSKQELMNQMLSSYWILDELTGLVGETESTSGSPADAGRRADQRSPEPDDRSTERRTPDSDRDREPVDQSDRSTTDSTEDSIREIQAAIRELAEATAANNNQQGQQRSPNNQFGPPSGFDGGVVSVVSELQRQIGSFQSKIDELENQQDTQFERLSNELQLLMDRVNELELEQNRFVEEDDLGALANDIDDLYDRLDELESSEDVEELNRRIEELETADEELETRMDREFDSIEELFRRVLDAIDDLDSDIDTATESYRSELEPIQQREAERKQLEELKANALRKEIRRGACENCDQRIDIALLESPECPNCSSRFERIEDSGWNPFRSPKLRTEAPPVDEV